MQSQNINVVKIDVNTAAPKKIKKSDGNRTIAEALEGLVPRQLEEFYETFPEAQEAVLTQPNLCPLTT